MDGTSKFETDFSSLESCICAFRDCMAPAMHLLPDNIIETLTKNGFFTSPTSTWLDYDEQILCSVCKSCRQNLCKFAVTPRRGGRIDQENNNT